MRATWIGVPNVNDMPKMANGDRALRTSALHPAWVAPVHYCAELKYGEIDSAEYSGRIARHGGDEEKKVRFTNA